MTPKEKPADYFQQTRHEMLPFLPDKVRNALDVGCGIGTFGEAVQRAKNATAWGIELDANQSKIAGKRLHKVIAGDIFSAYKKLPKRYFDVIIFNDVLEHLVDPYAALDLCKAHLAENGVVVASIPNVRHINNLKNFLFKRDWKYENEGTLDRTHLRFFTEKSIRRLFEEQGFIITRLEGINPHRDWRFSLVNFLLGGLLSDARYLQFAIVAKPSSAN